MPSRKMVVSRSSRFIPTRDTTLGRRLTTIRRSTNGCWRKNGARRSKTLMAHGILHSLMTRMVASPRKVIRGRIVSDENPSPKPDALRLDHFLKLKVLWGTGGQAKLLIQG